jgi:hypothetical protein
MRKAKITKSKAIEEVDGAISHEHYEPGDFVQTTRPLRGRLQEKESQQYVPWRYYLSRCHCI